MRCVIAIIGVVSQGPLPNRPTRNGATWRLNSADEPATGRLVSLNSQAAFSEADADSLSFGLAVAFDRIARLIDNIQPDRGFERLSVLREGDPLNKNATASGQPATAVGEVVKCLWGFRQEKKYFAS